MAWVMLSAGTLMIALSISILFYGWWGRSQLDELVSTVSVNETRAEGFLLTSDRDDRSVDGTGFWHLENGNPLQSMIRVAVMYPGENMPPTVWSDPAGREAILNIPVTITDEYNSMSPSNIPERHTLAAPKTIQIDSIGLNANVESLRILNLENSFAYETPNNVVGHIPESSNAGERGTAWFFGHLQSPIRGEGSVFSELPKIPDLMRQGIPIYAEVDNGELAFLYHLTSTDIVHGDELELYETGGPSIILVTCVPVLFYDHRLVVTGELVGVKKMGNALNNIGPM
jgi:LPXTG-site transpeptidase (sortase) family protein